MPQASRMRGIWEHQICTTHSVLPSLLLEHGRQLDNEALHRLMTEAERIVNSCPLTIENLTDPLTSKPLTPNHLLILKTQVVLPLPGKFDTGPVFLQKGGKESSTLQTSSGCVGRKNTAPSSKSVRNGSHPKEV